MNPYVTPSPPSAARRLGPRTPAPFSRFPFTLIELLTVIAVLAALVSLLLPALRNARERGQRLTCLSNQRQMGMAFFSFESDYGRLPNLKFAHGTFQTLEGQPWLNTSPTVDIYQNYTGTEEYRIFLAEHVRAKIGSLQNGKHIYIEDRYGGSVLRCPAAELNADAHLYDDGGGYGEFYKWGKFQMDLLPLGANILYWTTTSTGAYFPEYIPWRRTAGVERTREVALVGEVSRIGSTPQGSNNHRGQGLNVVWFDGSGEWVPLERTVQAGFELWAGSNRFGDTGIFQYRIASARYAQVGGGFRIQNFGTYLGNGCMNRNYPDQVQTHLDMIRLMGYAREVNFPP